MFGIQCESCQKYITGKVLEVTLQLVSAPKVPRADVSTGPPRFSENRESWDPGTGNPVHDWTCCYCLGDSFVPSVFLSDVLMVDHPGRMEGVGLFFNDVVSLSQ